MSEDIQNQSHKSPEAPQNTSLKVPESPSYPIPPPPEMTYQSQKELYDAAQSWAKEKGYALITTHSSVNDKEQRFTYQCDRSGICHSGEKPEGRLTKTKKTNCPFKMTGNYYKKKKHWKIVIKEPDHNHPPSEDSSAHAIHRRLNQEQKKLVSQLTHAGVRPLQIKSALMQETETPSSATLNTIYNHRNQMRMEHLEGRTPMEALIFEIHNFKFHHVTSNDDEGRMNAIFFAHPNSLTLARRFSTIFLLDCTYRTNKYKMPLLHIVGVDSSNRSFSAGFCFLSSEKEEDYVWALEQFDEALGGPLPSVLATDKEQALINAIDVVFPDSHHILCVWHVIKNIQLHCHQTFKSEEDWDSFTKQWNKLIQSRTEADYQENFTQISKLWNPETSDYLITNWFPIKEKFVGYLIHKHSHFGNTVTSRVEGLHAYIKRFINSSTGSFSAVIQQIYRALSIQLHERYVEATQQSHKQLLGLPPSLENLNGKITHFALKVQTAAREAAISCDRLASPDLQTPITTPRIKAITNLNINNSYTCLPNQTIENTEHPNPPAQQHHQDIQNQSHKSPEAPQNTSLKVPESPSYPIPPPPEMTYQSQKELYDAAQSWAKEKGYALITTHSSVNDKEQRFTYQCDRSGICHSGEKPEGRLTKTKKTNCPFKMTGNYYKKKKHWKIVIKEPDHNHPPSEDSSAHAIHRRLNQEQKKLVSQLTHAGVRPLQIKSALMQETETPSSATLNTIYNHRNQMRMEHLEGRTPMEALIFEIHNFKFHHVTSNDDEGRMNAIFFAHPNSLTLARRFSTIFLLDCTYRTNKYKMPLLHIVGVDSSNRSFSAGFCFLSSEKEEDYVWALEQFDEALGGPLPSVLATDKEQALINAIDVVFPDSHHILCVWHVIKNIQLHCHQTFKSEEDWDSFTKQWNKLIQSRTEADYQENFTQISKLWNPETSDYLITNWFPIKEKFVGYLIHKHSHFGNTVTSRVEGLHAYIKRFINSSTGSFSAVIQQIYRALSIQLHERYVEATQQSHKQLLGLPPSLENLNGKITHFALKVQTAAREGTQFFLDDFHKQWHVNVPLGDFQALPESETVTPPAKEVNEQKFLYDLFERFQAFQPAEQSFYLGQIEKLFEGKYSLVATREPGVKKTRGRPNGPSKKKKHESTTSSKRDPSAHEYQEKKKGRGRPKKEKGPIIPGAPKKRGRPCKKPDEEEMEAEETQSSEEELPEDVFAVGPQSGKHLSKKVKFEHDHNNDNGSSENRTGSADTSDSENGQSDGSEDGNGSEDGIGCEDGNGSENGLSAVDVHRYQYKESINPKESIPHISVITNVSGDGNCGFRAAAVSMGHPEDDWAQIRSDMKDKMEANPFYSNEKYLDNVWGKNKQDLKDSLGFDFKDELWPSPMVDSWWKPYATEESKAWKEAIQPNLDLGEKVLYRTIRRSSRISKKATLNVD
ncbi:hypothetical protein MJO28_009161 [Puccinia striiformis f. sp. tritici]|uniref:Uncharacterized protein n=1 Tax=Puccinia striiformis f. sp. tritici TaxID=168172 RepID=A0ACC0E701_9BASI|nr:hypothetical protein MJO28_009161 [Puccinia striiformis f. sp. tritici]